MSYLYLVCDLDELDFLDDDFLRRFLSTFGEVEESLWLDLDFLREDDLFLLEFDFVRVWFLVNSFS